MVSIKDVAKRAEVAISTVSKVLNNYPNVSEGTKKKVRQAIEELNFVPNTVAAALSSKHNFRIALLINTITQTKAIDEIDMQYLSGAIHKAKELNLDVVPIFFSMIEEKSIAEIIAYFQSQSITGIIVYGLSKDDKVLHKLIERQIFKMVLIDAPLVNSATSAVWVNQKQAQYDVAKKTITENMEVGHSMAEELSMEKGRSIVEELSTSKRILYIAGKKNGYVTEERIKGMKQLAQELNLQLMIQWGEFSELQARQITFAHAHSCDVVICASDLMAIGAMKALMEMDIFRPVCGFDGITLMGYVGKQMNTIRQSFSAISARAVEELWLLMKDQEGREVILPHTIVRLHYEDIIC